MLNLENQLEYGGGLDDLFSRPKKELTEEQVSCYIFPVLLPNLLHI